MGVMPLLWMGASVPTERERFGNPGQKNAALIEKKCNRKGKTSRAV